MKIMNEVQGLVGTRERLVIDMQATLERLKDTSIPLHDRWEAYKVLVEKDILTDSDTYGDGYLDKLGGDLTQYDHFHNDRGNTVRFIDMAERIDEGNEWDEDLVIVRESPNYDQWKEFVLASGFASFTYDW